MKLLRKWWFYLIVLVVFMVLAWSGSCSFLRETDRGDATHVPNSTIQLTVESFYG